MAESKKRRWYVALGQELGQDWVKGGLLLLVPTVPTVITAVSGYLRDLPLWAIVASSTVTAAAVLTSIRAYVEVSYRLRVKGRLVAGHAVALIGQKTNGLVEQLGVGLNLVNQASQSLEYKVVSANLVIDGRVNTNPTWKDHSAVVPVNGVVLFRLDSVSVRIPKAGADYKFEYEVSFDYGQPGDLKHRLDVKLRGTFAMKSPTEIAVFDSVNA